MLEASSYGKSKIRLAKVERHAGRHDFRELTVHIRFTGAYDDCYLAGDNARILPTDTMKNTVYALARKQPLGAIEEFGGRLCEHFLPRNPHLRSVAIDLEEIVWERLSPHAFRKGPELRTARVVDGQPLESGLKHLVLLKTTGSSFAGYIQDEYTTLPETADRILSTAVEASWSYKASAVDYNAEWGGVRACLVDSFMQHLSPSVQSTLYAMGQAVLAGFPAVEQIRLALPNKHYLPVNLEALGLDNPNEIFLPVDEPHGLIEATLRR